VLNEINIKGFPRHFLHWFKWIFISKDVYPAIAFLFIGRRNPTNVRFLSLYRETKTVRVVYMRGSRFKGVDRVYLRFFQQLINLSYAKIRRYEWFNYLALPNRLQSEQNGLLQIDDPEYTPEEKQKIKNWERRQSVKGKKSVIVCTNDFTKEWLNSFLLHTTVEVVEQGFIKDSCTLNSNKFINFSCVYSSPFVHYLGDKHENHKMWGAKILIDEIIPSVYKRDKNIEFHIIGSIGKHAFKALELFPNVVFHGLQSPEETMKILSKCHLGIYPRMTDNYRRVLKIYEFIGAEIPIVTFELEDTRIVREEDLGVSVSSVSEFVEGILELKNNKSKYDQKLRKIRRARFGRSWAEQGKKIDYIHLEVI
jgi:glycosyltransferase involved in cell wall biosynthesis